MILKLSKLLTRFIIRKTNQLNLFSLGQKLLNKFISNTS